MPKQEYPFTTIDGNIAMTSLTPEAQLAIQEHYLEGQTLNEIVQNLDLDWRLVHEFVTRSRLLQSCLWAREQVLAEQYHEAVYGAFATAGERIAELRQIGEKLLGLAGQTLDKWQDAPPDMTPTGLSRILEKFLAVQTAELKLRGIAIDSKQVTHLVKEVPSSPSRQITVQEMLEAGLGIDDIHALIEIVEQKRAIEPRHTKRIGAPGHSADEGGSGALLLSAGPQAPSVE